MPLFFRNSQSSCFGVSRLKVLGTCTVGYCLYTAGFEKPKGHAPLRLPSPKGAAGNAGDQASALDLNLLSSTSAADKKASCAAARAAVNFTSTCGYETSLMQHPAMRSGSGLSREARPDMGQESVADQWFETRCELMIIAFGLILDDSGANANVSDFQGGLGLGQVDQVSPSSRCTFLGGSFKSA